MKNNNIPIKISGNEKNGFYVQASLMDPISWITKEKETAKMMLSTIEELKLNGDPEFNKKKVILKRIYNEYIIGIDEMFDKRHSLRLIERLKD